MRLLQPKEREVAYKKQENAAKAKAIELSQGVTELTKSFNRVKEELGREKKYLLEAHQVFIEEIEDEKRRKNEELEKLEKECEIALEPLYEKERVLARKSEDLSSLEEEVTLREKDVRWREVEADKRLKHCDSILKIAEEKERVAEEKESNLSRREAKFNKFMAGQRDLFKRDEQKLRDWLEKEREKIRKQNNA